MSRVAVGLVILIWINLAISIAILRKTRNITLAVAVLLVSLGIILIVAARAT